MQSLEKKKADYIWMKKLIHILLNLINQPTNQTSKEEFETQKFLIRTL